jgi:adenylate cyclase
MVRDWDWDKLKAHTLAMADPASRIKIYEQAIEKHKRIIKRLRYLIKVARKQITTA